MSENILSVQNLHTSFHTDKGEVKAVNGVTFNLEKGKILGIVGESGSGKSVTAYSIMRILEKNGRITEGKILYKGQDIAEFSEKQMREFRGKCCSIIFQDPMTSLNPVFTVGNQLKEAIELHTDRKGKEAEARAIEMLTLVAYTIFKEGYRFAHNILLSFFFIGCFFKFFQIHLKAQRRFLGHLIHAIGFAAHCFLLSYSSVILGSISL